MTNRLEHSEQVKGSLFLDSFGGCLVEMLVRLLLLAVTSFFLFLVETNGVGWSGPTGIMSISGRKHIHSLFRVSGVSMYGFK